MAQVKGFAKIDSLKEPGAELVCGLSDFKVL
jgi:hypothetical protein